MKKRLILGAVATLCATPSFARDSVPQCVIHYSPQAGLSFRDCNPYELGVAVQRHDEPDGGMTITVTKLQARGR